MREARAYIDKIDAMGGARAAIERGYQQHEIAEAAYARQRAIEKTEQVIVGVNRYGASIAGVKRSTLSILRVVCSRHPNDVGG